MPSASAGVFKRYEGRFEAGYIYVVNDPYSGGRHLPDVFLFKPIYADGTLIAFAGVIAHQTDIGGRVSGGNASDNTEIYQEGVRIPPPKLFDRGVPHETLFSLLAINVRMPDKALGELRAQEAG